jgi:hypothetical protein
MNEKKDLALKQWTPSSQLWIALRHPWTRRKRGRGKELAFQKKSNCAAKSERKTWFAPGEIELKRNE